MFDVVILDSLAAFVFECLSRGEGAAIHQNGNGYAGGGVGERVFVSCAPLDDARLRADVPEEFGLSRGTETVFEHAYRLCIGAHKQVEIVRLGFQQ